MEILEVGPQHSLRPSVERYIRTVYRRAFGARVTAFAPVLFASVDASGCIGGAAGVRTGYDPFHAECYLDRPVEQIVSQALSRPVDRSELLELTSLACADGGDALSFVSQIVQRGRSAGCDIAVFTATRPLRCLLERAGLAITPIAVASRDSVARPLDWGRYYDADPYVCIAPDSPCVPQLLRGPRFASLRPVQASDAPVRVTA